MTESLPTIDDLIRLVENASGDTDPLQQLTDSVVLAARIVDLGDELVGRFVESARSAGATWEEVGECMAVSKQAAQKRFTATGHKRRGGFFLTRLAEEARQVVRRAATHAHEAGSSHVGTDHLVLGVIDDPQSIAARTIAELGGSLDEIRSTTQSNVESGSTPRAGGPIPFSPEAKKVLELALRETIRSGDRRIATQHILLGILRDEKSPGARLLIERGITRKAAEKWIEEI